MTMFKMEFLVDDKRLGEVFRMLSGKVYEVQAKPADNVQPAKNGKVKEQSALSRPEQMFQKLAKMKKFTTEDARNSYGSVGGVSKRANSVLHVWLKNKRIKRVAPGRYEVIERSA